MSETPVEVPATFREGAHATAWASVLERWPNAGPAVQTAVAVGVDAVLDLVRRTLRERQPDPLAVSGQRTAAACERIATTLEAMHALDQQESGSTTP